MAAPNILHPGIGKDGSPRLPATDEEARAAGLQKLVRKSDGAVFYRYGPDVREFLATGGYTWETWT